MTGQVWVDHEKRIRAAQGYMWVLLLIAALLGFLPFIEPLRPAGEALGTWWQRAGAPMAIFAFLAQNKAQRLGALITPGSFTSREMEALRKAYRCSHQLGLFAASTLTVAGTVIWGYGDLIVRSVAGYFGVP